MIGQWREKIHDRPLPMHQNRKTDTSRTGQKTNAEIKNNLVIRPFDAATTSTYETTKRHWNMPSTQDPQTVSSPIRTRKGR